MLADLRMTLQETSKAAAEMLGTPCSNCINIISIHPSMAKPSQICSLVCKRTIHDYCM